jgi:soluble lytic murein transglycosylase-like protein
MLVAVILLLFLSTPVLAGSLRSYVNEQGVRIFTNIGVRRPSGSALENRPGSAARVGNRYTSLIRQTAARHSLDENLVRAIVQVESSYNPLAVSPKGCIGLMQLHPATAERFGVRDSFDPVDNVEGGVRYLNFLMNEFERDLPRVLAAYNAGEQAVARHNGVPPYRETQDYVRKVTALYQTLGPSPVPAAASAVRPHSRRLRRIVQPNGSILFTNWADADR